MKSNLTLKKFNTNSVPGTMNQKELRTFFGSKIIYSENIITINDDSIDFSHVVSNYNNGYQYFDKNTIPNDWEVEFSENLTDLKNNYHTIGLLSQTSENLLINTRWQINIDAASILINYLYFRIKQQRVFKVINSNELYSKDINTAVYEYVKNNLFSRYRLIDVKFYIKYYDIKEQQSLKKNVLLQYNPKFNVDVYTDENYTKLSSNYDPYKFDSVILQYNQTKPSNQYSFDYYFDLVFSKI